MGESSHLCPCSARRPLPLVSNCRMSGGSGQPPPCRQPGSDELAVSDVLMVRWAAGGWELTREIRPASTWATCGLTGCIRWSCLLSPAVCGAQHLSSAEPCPLANQVQGMKAAMCSLPLAGSRQPDVKPPAACIKTREQAVEGSSLCARLGHQLCARGSLQRCRRDVVAHAAGPVTVPMRLNRHCQLSRGRRWGYASSLCVPGRQ